MDHDPIAPKCRDERPARDISPDGTCQDDIRPQAGEPASRVRGRAALAQGNHSWNIRAVLERPPGSEDDVKGEVADHDDTSGARARSLGGARAGPPAGARAGPPAGGRAGPPAGARAEPLARRAGRHAGRLVVRDCHRIEHTSGSRPAFAHGRGNPLQEAMPCAASQDARRNDGTLNASGRPERADGSEPPLLGTPRSTISPRRCLARHRPALVGERSAAWTELGRAGWPSGRRHARTDAGTQRDDESRDGSKARVRQQPAFQARYRRLVDPGRRLEVPLRPAEVPTSTFEVRTDSRDGVRIAEGLRTFHRPIPARPAYPALIEDLDQARRPRWSPRAPC